MSVDTRQPNKSQAVLAWSFITIIAAVPLGQAIFDAASGKAPQVVNLFDRAPTETHLRRFESDLEDHSWFERQLRPIVRRSHFLLFGDAGSKVLRGTGDWLFYKPGVEYLVRHRPERQLDDVADVIHRFQLRLASHGIRLLVVPVPGKASVYPERLTSRLSADASRHWVTKSLIQRLTKLNVETIDLHEAFQRARVDPGKLPPLFLERDTHWSSTGIQVAAQSIRHKLQTLGWIQPTNGRPWRKVSKRVNRVGDLVTMSKLNKLSNSPLNDSLDVWQIHFQGKPVTPTPLSDVLLLGDSFSRIFETDAPQAAGLPSHLAFQLGRRLTTIVNDGGASTLVRQELARRVQLLKQKKLVIWEFVERDILFGTEGWQDVEL